MKGSQTSGRRAAGSDGHVGRGPIVIGGTGGSGTRAVQRALEAAGVFMGTRLNDSGDAMDFEPFLDSVINDILLETRSLAYDPESLSAGLRQRVHGAFRAALNDFRSDLPSDAEGWGWKNPRSMYVLPLLATQCPGLRFIHLVRDGRDMAISENKNQPRKHYAALFNAPENKDDPLQPDPELSIRLWARANGDTAAFGERVLGPAYLRVSFEQLCAAPVREMTRILTHAGLSEARISAKVDRSAEEISAPGSLGRWRTLSDEIRKTLWAIAGNELSWFGYPESAG